MKQRNSRLVICIALGVWTDSTKAQAMVDELNAELDDGERYEVVGVDLHEGDDPSACKR